MNYRKRCLIIALIVLFCTISRMSFRGSPKGWQLTKAYSCKLPQDVRIWKMSVPMENDRYTFGETS